MISKKISIPKKPSGIWQRHRFLLVAAILSNLGLLAALAWYLHTAANKPYSLTVSETSSTAQRAAVYYPDEGKKYVILTADITQRFKTPIWIAPVTQSYILSDDGHKHTMSPYVLDKPFVAGIYQPGQTVSGQLSYQVPAKMRNLQLCFDIGSHIQCRKLNL